MLKPIALEWPEELRPLVETPEVEAHLESIGLKSVDDFAFMDEAGMNDIKRLVEASGAINQRKCDVILCDLW